MSLSERNVMIRKGAYHFDPMSSESTISNGHSHVRLPSLTKYFLIKVFVARQIPMEGGNIIYDTIGQKWRTPVFRNMQVYSSKDNGYNCNTQYTIAIWLNVLHYCPGGTDSLVANTIMGCHSISSWGKGPSKLQEAKQTFDVHFSSFDQNFGIEWLNDLKIDSELIWRRCGPVQKERKSNIAILSFKPSTLDSPLFRNKTESLFYCRFQASGSSTTQKIKYCVQAPIYFKTAIQIIPK